MWKINLISPETREGFQLGDWGVGGEDLQAPAQSLRKQYK